MGPVKNSVKTELGDRGWEVETLQLRDIDISPCTGCFGCWNKTPGICVVKDDARDVTRKIVNCDLLVLLTPITFGGYSSELKKAMDRSLGWMLPHMTTIQGKTHHKPRYRRYPDLVVLGTLPAPDAELESIFRDVVDRNAINAHSPGHAAGVLMEGTTDEAIRTELVALLQQAGVVG
jgi:multimeric flavodoxin WrbA